MTTTDFELKDNHIFVEALIPKPIISKKAPITYQILRLLSDTGATRTVIDSYILEALNYPYQKPENQIVIATASKSIVEYRCKITSFECLSIKKITL
jgi:hypothetical protein